MTAYHLLLLLGPLALFGSLTRSRVAQLVVLAIITVVAVAYCGLRWYADVDYDGYEQLFVDTPLLGDFTPEAVRELYGEPGYLLLSSLLRSAGIGFFALTLLCALVAIVGKAFVIQRLVRSAGMVLFLYLCIHFITIEFIQIRWAVASALIALGFLFQYQRSLWLAVACLGLAFSFHYFSIVFFAVAALLEIRRESHLNLVLAAFGLSAAAVAGLGLAIPIGVESDIYILKRAIRYLTETLSTVGLMSYLKVSIYPLAYLALMAGKPELHATPPIQFLRRLSFTLVVFTLALSVVPVMHHRTVVLADLFSLMLLVRIIDLRFAAAERLVVLVALTIPYATWFVLDIDANFRAHTLNEYSTWIPLIF